VHKLILGYGQDNFFLFFSLRMRSVSELKMLTFPSNDSTTAIALFARGPGKLLDCKRK